MATLSERAFQIWPVLVHAARNRQMLTYGQLQDYTGMAASGMGKCLEPIQEYCLANGLPPLTLIVGQKESGLPGLGFSAIKIDSPEAFAKALAQVFRFDYSNHAPSLGSQRLLVN